MYRDGFVSIDIPKVHSLEHTRQVDLERVPKVEQKYLVQALMRDQASFFQQLPWTAVFARLYLSGIRTGPPHTRQGRYLIGKHLGPMNDCLGAGS